MKLIKLFEANPVLWDNNSGKFEKTAKSEQKCRLVGAFDKKYIIRELFLFSFFISLLFFFCFLSIFFSIFYFGHFVSNTKVSQTLTKHLDNCFVFFYNTFRESLGDPVVYHLNKTMWSISCIFTRGGKISFLQTAKWLHYPVQAKTSN